MKIGVNASPWGDRPAGLSRYTDELVHNLASTGMPLKFHLYTPERERLSRMVEQSAVVSGTDIPQTGSFWQKRICWEQRYLPSLIEDSSLDIFHAPVYVLPLPHTLGFKVKTVVTVHDLIFEFRPKDYSEEALAYLNLYVPLSLKMAHHIIAISESTKQDIIDTYGIEDDRISVIPLAAGRQFKQQPALAVQELRQAYGLKDPFILHVGSFVKRKNLPAIIEAFAMIKAGGAKEKLVLAGHDARIGSCRQEILAKITSLDLQKEVIITDYFPDRDLPKLYSAAKALIYVPAYEGFGLPPLEAMASGTPVIAANNSALPEVVGDAALSVPAGNPFALAEAMEQLL
ncbi:MAG: glycosyltransferase family 4 protein, partial [Terriglobia bacterium]